MTPSLSSCLFSRQVLLITRISSCFVYGEGATLHSCPLVQHMRSVLETPLLGGVCPGNSPATTCGAPPVSLVVVPLTFRHPAHVFPGSPTQPQAPERQASIQRSKWRRINTVDRARLNSTKCSYFEAVLMDVYDLLFFYSFLFYFLLLPSFSVFSWASSYG